jgi:hypothetical protein
MDDLHFLAIEAILRRWASLAELQNEMILRGSLLTRQLARPAYRPAKDIDFLATFARDVARTDAFIDKILGLQIEGDAANILLDTFVAEDTWLNTDTPGRRYFVDISVETEIIRIQLDIAYNDTIYPDIYRLNYQLEGGGINVLPAVAAELLMAWKTHGLFEFWTQSDRWLMKDLYDIALLLQVCEIDTPLFIDCLRVAFADKKTPFSVYAKLQRDDFGKSTKTRKHWLKFAERMNGNLIADNHLSILRLVRAFLDPIFEILLREIQ